MGKNTHKCRTAKSRFEKLDILLTLETQQITKNLIFEFVKLRNNYQFYFLTCFKFKGITMNGIYCIFLYISRNIGGSILVDKIVFEKALQYVRKY